MIFTRLIRGSGCGFQGSWRRPGFAKFPVAMARGKHLFPFRTEQLSPSAPMVLGLHGPGRVGRRRFSFYGSAVPRLGGGAFVVLGLGLVGGRVLSPSIAGTGRASRPAPSRTAPPARPTLRTA